MHGFVPSDLHVAIAVASFCQKLQVVELQLPYRMLDLTRNGNTIFGTKLHELVQVLLEDSKPEAANLKKLSIFGPNQTILLMTSDTSPLGRSSFDCITAGDLQMLQDLVVDYASCTTNQSNQPTLDEAVLALLPRLEFLDVGNANLYCKGYSKQIRGALTVTNMDTFQSASQVHCLGWSGCNRAMQNSLSTIYPPFSSMTSWTSEST